jgi:hypothetical protein
MSAYPIFVTDFIPSRRRPPRCCTSTSRKSEPALLGDLAWWQVPPASARDRCPGSFPCSLPILSAHVAHQKSQPKTTVVFLRQSIESLRLHRSFGPVMPPCGNWKENFLRPYLDGSCALSENTAVLSLPRNAPPRRSRNCPNSMVSGEAAGEAGRTDESGVIGPLKWVFVRRSVRDPGLRGTARRRGDPISGKSDFLP